MRCDEFEARLNHLLDHRLDPRQDRLASRHAERCPDCQRLMDAYQSLCDSLDGFACPAGRDDLAQRVLGQLTTESTTTHATTTSRPWLSLAITTAASVLVVLASRTPSPSTPLPIGPPLIAAAPAAEKHLPSPPAAPVGVLARQASEKYADLARDTRAALSAVALLLPMSDEEDLATSASPAGPPVDVAAPLSTQVAAGLKPLTDSTTGAMSFLWNMLPHTQPAGRLLEPSTGNTSEPLVRHDTI